MVFALPCKTPGKLSSFPVKFRVARTREAFVLQSKDLKMEINLEEIKNLIDNKENRGINRFLARFKVKKKIKFS